MGCDVIRHLLIILLATASAMAEPTTLTLRRTARILPGQALRVGDVAVIEGPLAQQAARTLLLNASELEHRLRRGWLSVGVQEVAAAIGIDPPDLLVRGSTCQVGVIASPPTIEPVRQGAELRPPTPTGPTVLDLVTARLCEEFGVAPTDLRLTFDDRYASTLRTPVGACTADIHPTGRSADMPMSVTLYDADRIVLSETVRLRVEIRRSVAVVDRLIARRATIEPSQYHFETRWTVATDEPALPAHLAGAQARTTLEPGQVIEARHVEAPIIVRRGDLVAVRIVSGSIVAKITARALSEGRDGDRVQFEPINGGQRFVARMNGPGRAVLNQTEQIEQEH